MEGKIEVGDLDQVKRIATNGKLFVEGDPEKEMTGDSSAVICLNSPGGSFVEGVALARFVSQRGIATVIDEHAECLSACAIVFMAGRTLGAEEDYVNRKLHVSGTLGFHRPYLTFSDTDGKSYSGKDLNNSADFIIDAVTFMLSLSNEKGNFDSDKRMKSSLIQLLLEKDRNDLLVVDTVDEAGRWGIDVFGEKKPLKFTNTNLYNACANFIAWSIDESNSDETILENSVWQLQQLEQPALGVSQSFKVIPGKNGYSSVECTVNVYESEADGTPFLRICASDGFTGLTYGNCYSKTDQFDVWVNPISIYSPKTKLRDLKNE